MTGADMGQLQNISCDCANFEELRRSGAVYVDKTSFVHRIAASPHYKGHFLSRPRRFGKSLLCSTFKALFEGRKDLFSGLAIEHLPWNWQAEKRPVLSLTMPAVSNVEEYTAVLGPQIRWNARQQGVELAESHSPIVLFQGLIYSLAEKSPDGKIAVVIDEFDAPLLHCCTDARLAMKEALAAFYGQLKVCGDCIRFLFITGVTKFSKISIFSQLNNFEDISLDPAYGAILGYTRQELEAAFPRHLAALAETMEWSAEECRNELARRYDGFRFTENPERVFNPFSLANVLALRQLKSYWATSGTPSFLADEMRRRNWLPSFTYGETEFGMEDFDFFDLETALPEMLLFQTGYLTIKEISGGNAILDFPNAEVRSAMLWNFFQYLRPSSMAQVNTYADDIRKAAMNNDIPGVIRLLKSHFDSFAGCDTEHIRKYEGFYQTIITTILQFACCRMDVHQQGNLGIQDAAVYSIDTIYIFELKVDGTPEQAIQQCLEKNYAGKYIRDGRKIKLVGLSCDSRTRSLNDCYLIQDYAG